MVYLYILTLFLLPTYVVRFNFFGLPANLLLIWTAFLALLGVVWLGLSKNRRIFFGRVRLIPSWLWLFSGLFFISGVLSLLVAKVTAQALGQFIVLFLEPMVLGVLAVFIFRKESDKKLFVWSLLIFVGLAGMLALLQYQLLWYLPESYWGNSLEPKRAIAFFTHPNGYALFVAPLLAFLLPQLKKSASKESIVQLGLWLLGAVGLLLSLSRGGWLGLSFAAGVWVFIAASKKLRLVFVGLGIVALLFIFAIPNLRYRAVLPFKGEKSTVARFSLWNTGWKMVVDNPVLGKGLTGFDRNWYVYNTDPGLDHYNFPHNIFLNFWVDTGLLGLISFLLVLLGSVWHAYRNKSNTLTLGLGLFVFALIIHGGIDIPYLKNDLALLFWMIVGFAFAASQIKGELDEL